MISNGLGALVPCGAGWPGREIHPGSVAAPSGGRESRRRRCVSREGASPGMAAVWGWDVAGRQVLTAGRSRRAGRRRVERMSNIESGAGREGQMGDTKRGGRSEDAFCRYGSLRSRGATRTSLAACLSGSAATPSTSPLALAHAASASSLPPTRACTRPPWCSSPVARPPAPSPPAPAPAPIDLC